MKRNGFAFLVCLCAVGQSIAQPKQDTLFYDNNWKGVESVTFATYYRVVSESDDANFGRRIRDFYVTGELQGESRYISIDKYDDSKSVFDGEYATYYKSGQVAEKGVRINGVREGEYTAYYENGLVRTHCTLKNGLCDGILTEFDETGEKCCQTEMSDGKPCYDYYVLSDKDGYCSKFRIGDDAPIWESPSYEEQKTEYRDGEPWPYYVKNGLVVMANNNQTRDYGKWYRISVEVYNNSVVPIVFDPVGITSSLMKADGQEMALEVYSAEQYMKKVNRSQTWTMALTGVAEGLAAAGAGYSTSTTHTNSRYGGHSNSYGSAYAYGSGGYAFGGYSGNSSYHGSTHTTSTTVTYDAAAAYQAQVLASNRIASLGNALQQEKQVRQEGYLKKTTVYPGEAISGYVNVKHSKGATLDVVIDINGARYEFVWNVKKK